ncbi:MAG: polysaccharide deacetylase family protein [Syntrophothermus sp.]
MKGDTTKKELTLVFTGHEFADGYNTISSVLKKHYIKAGFFFTGDFYRNPNYSNLIKELKKNGHYLGAHSDKHILYASWEKRDSTLVTKKEFTNDILNNYAEMKKFGINKADAPYFMPPFEWYNKEIVRWTEELGLTLINYSPGSLSNADYTIPVPNERYYSSDSIYNKILHFEKNNPSGLNGFILLTHIGTDPRRIDKFYNRLDNLITDLKKKGYKFVSLTEFLKD